MVIGFAHKLHHACRVSATNAVTEALMLELTLMHGTREETPNAPGKISCLDARGYHHLFSEKNGIFFYEGKMDDDICISEESSRYGTYVQHLAAQAPTSIH